MATFFTNFRFFLPFPIHNSLKSLYFLALNTYTDRTCWSPAPSRAAWCSPLWRAPSLAGSAVAPVAADAGASAAAVGASAATTTPVGQLNCSNLSSSCWRCCCSCLPLPLLRCPWAPPPLPHACWRATRAAEVAGAVAVARPHSPADTARDAPHRWHWHSAIGGNGQIS